MRGNRLSRVNRLEARAADLPPPVPWPETDAEWLAYIEELAREGFFRREPDFPVALEIYRAAVAAAGPGTRNLREWEWIAEMAHRIYNGKPALTEVEYKQLEQWFRENEDRIPGNECVDLGGGRRVSRSSIRGRLEAGPRRDEATQVVEDLRALRAVLGERPSGEGLYRDSGGTRALFVVSRREPGARPA
jgi:hypothetical protein